MSFDQSQHGVCNQLHLHLLMLERMVESWVCGDASDTRREIWGAAEAHFPQADSEYLYMTGGWRGCTRSLGSWNMICSRHCRRPDLTFGWGPRTSRSTPKWYFGYRRVDVSYHRSRCSLVLHKAENSGVAAAIHVRYSL
jgi:hypothetical protein